ncbi:MAG TPA: phage portal protein, partial [Solibacillus sp.]
YFDDPLIRKAYCGAEWNGPSQGQIDPLKEVNAAIKRVDEGFSTRAKETAELTGGDFWRNLPQRIREERAMKEGGLKDAEEVLEDDEQSEEQPAGEADS